ncbi:MAG: AAA family ATPase [Lachnospiraceae bacterium]|nr:AAA family ATPase [Lachnospiraceae bacterium]
MIIREIYIRRYGVFDHYRLQFNPGLNLIYGENETGKSTLASFVHAMLFGLEPGRSKVKMDEYSLRLPWEEPSLFGGEMLVEDEGRCYRIRRCFYRSDRSFQIVDEETGLELEEPQRALDGWLDGMTEALSLQTIFIRQGQEKAEQGLIREMQSTLASMDHAGEMQVDAEKALQRLMDRKKAAENQRRVRLKQLDETIEQKREALALIRKMDEAELAAGQTLLKPEGNDGMDRFRGEAPLGHGPSTVLLDRNEWNASGSAQDGAERRETMSARSDHTGQTGETREMVWAEPVLERDDQLLKHSSNLLLGLVLVASLLAGILALMISGTMRILLLAGCSVGLLTVLVVLAVRKQTRTEVVESAVYHDSQKPDEEVRKALEARAALRRQEDQARQQLKKAERAARRAREEELREQLEALYAQRDRVAGDTLETEALELAAERLKELSREQSRDLSEPFFDAVSQLTEQLTKGAYDLVCLDEKGQVMVRSVEDDGKLLRLEQLSGGTLRLISLAIRFGAARVVSGERVPAVLDEAFAMYDNDRLAAVMKWLDHSSRQIILFSCQPREKQILDASRRNG